MPADTPASSPERLDPALRAELPGPLEALIGKVRNAATYQMPRRQIEETLRALLARAEAAEAELARLRAERHEAARVGWDACRKSLYAVCEDVQDEAAVIDGETGPAERYKAGARWAAKSIARGFAAMEAADDDNLRTALAMPAPEDA